MSRTYTISLDGRELGAMSTPVFVGFGELVHGYARRFDATQTWGGCEIEVVYAVGVGADGVAPEVGDALWATPAIGVELGAPGQVIDALSVGAASGVWAAWRVKTVNATELQIEAAMATGVRP